MGTDGALELLAESSVSPILQDATAIHTFGQKDNPRGKAEYLPASIDRVNDALARMNALLYDATPSTNPYANLLPNNILELRGYRLDHILASGNEYPGTSTSSLADCITVLIQWVQLLMQHSTQQDHDVLAQQFFSTLHQDQSSTRFDYTFTEIPESIQAIYPADTAIKFWQSIRLLSTLANHSQVEIEAAETFIQPILNRFQRRCMGRRFCITSKYYLGLFLPTSEPGDFVVLFSGARLPFCIRPIKNKQNTKGYGNSDFNLVGPVYLQDFMYGKEASTYKFDEAIRLR